ncbi:MAG: D-alanyl-D-alanine carboxypeptidase family protein [Terrisporobacter othiniensis]|uniref:D-alanyl-D-alanine carboxypeptidase family protein n=1 Tax=Terrisporobacter petrolearius TaxID=1460447 RepID=UPI0022E62A0C|nr:D-alanyl-D-alanine carboxypeptidase family protein [Terrisporobacter petrolearius]MDU4860039.1 D-alanyl-D-alanine carboxypeptidase family protein [Terrisporobacter othiniensis]MDU6994371.1 D-alanyl-D-alanine carboxypeptidase family protein [Terrisporobacter othiniensis]
MKKFLSFLLAFLFSITTFSGPISVFADSKDVSISSPNSVVLDYETGTVLYEKNGNKKIYPASTTKIWTAYLVIKNVKDLDHSIEIDKDLSVDGSSMYLQKGEIFTVRELLQGLLVHSSNDTAEVLAEYVSGSKEAFADLMNKEARAIGAKNTHFNNPHGLPDKEHYTTAYDMALMARQAMSNDLIREIVSTKSLTFEKCDTPTSKRFITRTFFNTNKFLTSTEKIQYKGKSVDIKYDIVDGIKTGYTDDAGRCLLSSAVKNDMRVISAVYKDAGTDVYADSRTLIDYAFNNYYNQTIINKADYTKSKRVLFTKEKELLYEPEFNYKIVLEKGSKASENYNAKVNLDYDLPIKKGDKVGTLDVYNGKTLEKTINLVAKNNLNSLFGFITENTTVKYSIKLALALISLFIIFIISKIIKKRKARRRRKSVNFKRK